MDEHELAGGVANAGRVTRAGGYVLRPCGPYSGSVSAFLLSLRAAGFEGARRRVEAGDPNFIEMWNEMGGAERFDRRRRWWAAQRQNFVTALR